MNTPKENDSKQHKIPAFDSETLQFVERSSAVGFSPKHITHIVLETFPYYGSNDNMTDEEIQNVITKRIHNAQNDKRRASYHRIQVYKKEFQELEPLIQVLRPLEEQRIEIKLSGDKDFNRMMQILNQAQKIQKIIESM